MTTDELLKSVYETIVQPIFLVLGGIALVVFLWGVAEYIRNSASEEGRSTGKKHIIWGIVGFVIMISVFGITRVVIDTLGLPEDEVPPLQQG